MHFERVVTERLTLEPVSRTVAEAIVRGDLTQVVAGDGWPHDDTCDGLGMALALGHAPGWLVVVDGVVIGDCGVHGAPDADGRVELGYGLSAAYRGRGYGSELVRAAAQALRRQPDVRQVVARGVLRENRPSRRALERAGFRVTHEDARTVSYALD